MQCLQMGTELDWVDSYNVSDGLIVCVCVRVIPCHMCETYLSKKDVGFHADMLCKGYKSVSLVTAHLLQQRTLSLCLNLCTSHSLQPTHLSLCLPGVVSLWLGVLPPVGKSKGAARKRGKRNDGGGEGGA